MTRSLRGEIVDTLSFAAGRIAHASRTFVQVCGEIERASPAARAASTTTLALVLAVLIACAMHLQDVWWAAISAFVSTNPLSIARGLRRILGTVAGAALAVAAIGWIAYDQFACCLALFAVTVIGTIGFNVSRHGYGWLFASITFGMVVLSCLSDPQDAVSVAVSRILEVAIGTCTAMAVGLVFSDGATPAPVPVRGWSGLLGSQLPITLHATWSGVTVALIPVVWSTFVLPSASQMAITLAVVLATPVAADADETHRRVLGRGLQRLLGCLLGGLAALVLLGLNLDSLLPWLLALASGIWLFAYVQHGSHDVTYVGTQAGVVFISTLVQGTGAPDSLLPGIDRFVGISLGLLMLVAAEFLIGLPGTRQAANAG